MLFSAMPCAACVHRQCIVQMTSFDAVRRAHSVSVSVSASAAEADKSECVVEYDCGLEHRTFMPPCLQRKSHFDAGECRVNVAPALVLKSLVHLLK